jgi:hypothetical protein
MNKILNFVKSKKIILLVIISLVSIAFLIYKTTSNNRSLKKEPTTKISSAEIASFKEIVPGKTSIEKVNELLGTPLDSTKSGDLNVSDYKTDNQYRMHKVYSKNGLAELVIEEVISNEKTAEDIQKTYGIATDILYEKTPLSTFNLYVYPKNGIAYLGHKDGTINEIWYFKPTSIEDFIKNWGEDYSKSPSNEVPQY